MRRLLVLLAAASIAFAACTETSLKKGPPRPGYSILYASRLQGEPTRILVHDLGRGTDRLLDIDYFGGLSEQGLTRWVGSPDGRWVALVDQTKIQIAPASRPLPLSRLAGRTTSNDRIGDAVWAPGGSLLFYVEYRRDRRRPTVELERRLYAITPDGKHRTRIGVFRQREAFELVGADLHLRQTYWLRSGEGGIASFSAIDIDSGRVRPVVSRSRLLSSFGFVLAHDFRSVYYVVYSKSGSQIVEQPLPQGRPRILFRMSREDASRNANLHAPAVSPDNRSLLFVQSAGETDMTFTITLATGKVAVLTERKHGNEILFPGAWSPDGRYLWIESAGSKSPLVLDLSTKRTMSIRGTPRKGAPEYRRYPSITFLAWLRTS